MVLRFFILASVLLLISCGEIERNNPDDPRSDNYQSFGFDRLEVVELGGPASTVGLSLDIDKLKVYKLSEIPNKTWIDLVFDGVSIWTPERAASASLASISAAFAGVYNEVIFFDVPDSTESAQDLVDAFDNSDGFFLKRNLSIGEKIGVFTSDGNLALVKVNEISATVLNISVSVLFQ